MLSQNGNNRRAQQLLQDVLDTASISAKHYTKLHKPWIQKAKQQLKCLET